MVRGERVGGGIYYGVDFGRVWVGIYARGFLKFLRLANFWLRIGL
jgi:hypothetical protein